MIAAYGSGYFEEGGHGYENYAEQASAQRATHALFLKRLNRSHRLGGRLLEAGCGYGYFLAASRPYFDYQTGLDFSPPALRAATPFADQVAPGGLEAVAGEKFHWIFAHQVIEHIYEPIPFVRSLHSLLFPGGHAVLTTPRARGFWHTLMGKRWASYKIPEHVAFFTPHHLENLLRGAGFEDVRILPFWHAFPLRLVLQKLGLSFSGLPALNIWIPGTTFAAVARVPVAD